MGYLTTTTGRGTSRACVLRCAWDLLEESRRRKAVGFRSRLFIFYAPRREWQCAVGERGRGCAPAQKDRAVCA